MLTLHDITDRELFTMLEQHHPQAAEILLQYRAGEAMHVPTTPGGSKMALVRLYDDGTRTRAEVARLAGCSISTVRRVRKKRKSRERIPASA